jgi:hypothetical protein
MKQHRNYDTISRHHIIATTGAQYFNEGTMGGVLKGDVDPQTTV